MVEIRWVAEIIFILRVPYFLAWCQSKSMQGADHDAQLWWWFVALTFIYAGAVALCEAGMYARREKP